MSEVTRWCAIADTTRAPEEKRYQALDKALKAAGLITEFQFLTTDETSIPEVLEKAKNEFAGIRFAGLVGAWVLPLLARLPSSILSLKAADSLVCDNHEWWPRFYLVEGLNQMFADDASTLDFSGSVFVFGATPEARGVIAAVSKIGFSKIIVSDPDESVCSAFVEELKKSYFGIQFQSVARQYVTQIPGICSIASNTLNLRQVPEAATELAYFNFLKARGFWLDLALFPLNTTLQTEAVSVGASIISGARGLALADRLWAEAAFKVSIDVDAYASELSF